ncbi:MAG: hypothetical protein ABIX28_08880 [Vicinamibacterales bacterium]
MTALRLDQLRLAVRSPIDGTKEHPHQAVGTARGVEGLAPTDLSTPSNAGRVSPSCGLIDEVSTRGGVCAPSMDTRAIVTTTTSAEAGRASQRSRTDAIL